MVGLVDDGDLDAASGRRGLLDAWSSSRPGQATTTSTPGASAAICRPAPTPPKTVIVRSDSAFASGAMAASIWVASSRVGARMSARGRPGAERGAGREPGEDG